MIVEEEKNDESLERIDVEFSPTSVLPLGEYALRSLAAVGVFPFFSSSDANLKHQQNAARYHCNVQLLVSLQVLLSLTLLLFVHIRTSSNIIRRKRKNVNS